MSTKSLAISGAATVLVTLASAAQSQPLQPFTVAEEINLAHFTRWWHGSPITVSPNGRLVAVRIERGVVDKDLVEDELRVYDTKAIREAVRHPGRWRAPRPTLDLHESTYKQGPIISQIRWWGDSRGLAFLLADGRGRNQLAAMSLKQAHPQVLSLKGQSVTAFAVRDLKHYAYCVRDVPSRDLLPQVRRGWTVWDASGRSFFDLLFPKVLLTISARAGLGVRSNLWAALGGRPHEVLASKSHAAVVVYPSFDSLALSPDGHTLATSLPVPSVPRRWLREFHHPYPAGGRLDLMRPGPQDLNASHITFPVDEYVLVDLREGKITPVNGSPTGVSNGWWTPAGPTWSADGAAVLLPSAYLLPAGAGQSVAGACAAVFYPATHALQCIERLRSRSQYVGSLRFAGQGADKVIIQYVRGESQVNAEKAKEYIRGAGGRWRIAAAAAASGPRQEKAGEIFVRQWFDRPPVLVVRDPHTRTAHVIWDPNPQLEKFALGEATVYRWRDATGLQWTGGLYRPKGFVTGRRYPLVIQTHGFAQQKFRPSGSYPTAFAARALAASGILVLQVPECPMFGPMEARCVVAGYEGAVKKLASQGLIDPRRVGIIGFSATVYNVMVALTSGSVQFAAASITDGVDGGYFQYLEEAGRPERIRVESTRIGADPFGPGLRLWLRRSPEFNMQKVHAPLLVNALQRVSLLGMWEPYATLRLLDKPVDLIILNSNEHVLTEPAVRLASQGGSVDWFRFWLQGYESPYPVMAGEYRRWEKLCDMQIEQNPGRPTFCVPTKRSFGKHLRGLRQHVAPLSTSRMIGPNPKLRSVPTAGLNTSFARTDQRAMKRARDPTARSQASRAGA